ncbi:MAG TPA: response regulator [Hyphomicrobiaceae bacterium]|nr:response regulator [Hyphomicrobiaceae bacterium]
MRDPPLILVADDNEANADILKTRLTSQGYAVTTAGDGVVALERARAELPDLILLDVMMPKLDGLEVARRIKTDPSLPFMPIVLVTAKADVKDVVAGLEAGGDEYLTKPVDQASLVARVRSLLRVKGLHDTVEAQSKQLALHAAELSELNRTLEARVAAQVAELDRMGRLRRFLPRQVAELVMASGDEKMLDSHRREVTVAFCDLRGFTAFAEVAEPEEVMAVLAEYHAVAGPLIDKRGGTLERFMGDGLMVLFNDPIPCPDPVRQGLHLAVELREAVGGLCSRWQASGHQLGFGVGIAHGFATIGRIGFDGRLDYTAIGTVVNQAARLCGEAKNGEILITQRVASLAGSAIETEPLGELPLKGLRQPVVCHRLLACVA